MLPSRGLRWSRQTIAIGRGRLEPLSARHCSSLVQNAPIRSRPLLKNGASPSRIYSRSSLPVTNPIRNATGVRFASTAPVSAAATPPATPPTEVLPSSLENVTEFTTQNLYDIPAHIGYLKSLGLDYGWGPTAFIEWIFEHIHVYTGMPFWVSISLTAFALRAVLFKGYISAGDNAARMKAVKPLTDPLTKKMMAAKGDEVQVLQLRSEIQTINKRAGVKLWKSLVPMVQVFTGYGTFVLLRAMANLPVPGMESGGALWFHDLTVHDPFFIIPVSTALALHWVLRTGGETGTASEPSMKILQVVLPAITLGITSFFPAAVQISFLVSGLLSLFQTTMFKKPAFRSFFKMYPLPAAPAPATGPYKGTMNVRAPLTQAELSQKYRPAATNAVKQGGVKGFMTDTVQGATKDITKTFSDATESAKELLGRGKKSLAERQAKADRAAAAAYEERRQKETKQGRRRSTRTGARRH